MINLETADWSTSRRVIMYSNIMSCVVMFFAIAVGVAIILYHVWANPDVWGRPEFKIDNGALLEGSSVIDYLSSLPNQAHLLIPPIVYFLRRIIFVLTIIKVQHFFAQVLIQMIVTLLTICMMVDRRRTESLLGYRIEITNEVLLVGLYYIFMGYGLFVLDGEKIHTQGFANIALLFTCIGVNAIHIVYIQIRSLVKWLKKKFSNMKCV